MESNQDAPLFKSAYTALAFAMSFQGHHQGSVMNQAAAGPSRPGKGLGGDDGAGQAGMIRARMMRLPELQRAAMIARFAPEGIACPCDRPCCSGWQPNREWTDAIAELTDEARRTAFAATSADRVARRAIVVRYFRAKDKKESIDALAKILDLNRKTVSGHIDRTTKWLRDIEKDALTAMDAYLRDFGPVGDEFLQAA